MQNKTPQGKADPVPTPEQELERYGVWVKSEPQDVLDEHVIDRETVVELPAEESTAAISLDEAEPAFDTLEDLPPLEDAFDDDFASLAPRPEPRGGSEEEPSEIEELAGDIVEDSVIDIDLDELEPSFDESGIGLGEADAQALEELSVEEPTIDEASAERPAVETGSFETTDISIEDFGLSDESESPSGPSLESLEADLESFSAPAEAEGASGPDSDFETLDIDLAFDDTIPSVETTEAPSAADSPALSDGFESIDIDSFDGESIPDSSAEALGPIDGCEPGPEAGSVLDPIEDGGADLSSEAGSLDAFIDDDASSAVVPSLEIEDVTLGDEPPEPASGFDDLKALENDLSGSDAVPSADLLGKIALELSSIRDELVSLRSQLSGLKAAGIAPAEEPAPVIEPSEEEPAAGGFFDDEDDDTIALTGDELDNILNTADFTEERVSDEPIEPVDSAELEVSTDIDLLPENGDYRAGIETIDLPTVEPDEAEQEAIIAHAEDLAPLIPAPEDTSFLDAEDEASVLEGMPLEDVPLVEPDLSELDLVVDSAFGSEDDEELPVIEPFDEGEEPALEEIEPEIVLDIDADEEPVVSTVDAFPEVLEEADDSIELEEILEPEDLGGLDLHSEEPSPLPEAEEPVAYGPEASIDSLESLEAMADELSEEAGIPETLDDLEGETLFEAEEESPLVELGTEPEPVEEHVIEEPEAPQPVSLEPETLEPEVLEIEVLEPEALEPESFEPEALEPEALGSEPLEPEALSEPAPATVSRPSAPAVEGPRVEGQVPDKLKHDVKSVLLYLDQLLASLPEEKIEEFASSEYYDTYKRLFDDLGLL